MAKEVKVLGFWVSPFSARVKLGLTLKGIDFEYVEEDLANKSPLLLESNPVIKKIPVLLHKGRSIVESLIILQYIDEEWPGGYPLLPQDPHQRAVARFWGAFVDEKIYQPSYKTMSAKGKELDETLDLVRQNLEILQNELGDKEFFGGDAIGYVDIAAFFVVYMLQMSQEISGLLNFTEERFCGLLKWVNKMREIEAVKASLPPRDQHMARFKARMEHLRASQ